MPKGIKGFQPGNKINVKPADQKAKMVSIKLSPEALQARDRIADLTQGRKKNYTQAVEDALLFYDSHVRGLTPANGGD